MKKKRAIKFSEFKKQLAFTKEDWERIDRRLRLRFALRELRESRKGLDLTQQQLSDNAGIPRTTISKIENGNLNVSLIKMMQLADAMDMRLEVEFVPIQERSKTRGS